jgi:hypothetical protein
VKHLRKKDKKYANKICLKIIINSRNYYYYYYYYYYVVVVVVDAAAAAFKLCYHPILSKILAINTYTINCNIFFCDLCLDAPYSEGRVQITDIYKSESKKNEVSDFDIT